MRMLTETPPGSAPAAGVGRGVSRLRRGLQRAALGAACLLLAGCGTTYLLQAASGEWHVLHARVPIDTLLADPHTRPSCARSSRRCARRVRSPRSSSGCRTTPATAATPTSVGRTWCGTWSPLPSSRCTRCAGAFRSPAASPTAATSTSGARARSAQTWRCAATTWRWKECRPTRRSAGSPTRCSRACCAYGDDELAATIFHELAHQLLYVRDDSEFNEAFAVIGRGCGPRALACVPG